MPKITDSNDPKSLRLLESAVERYTEAISRLEAAATNLAEVRERRERLEARIAARRAA